MGDPKKIRKKYKTPRQPFEKLRIEHDLQLVGKYGLRNMREVWKHSTMLRNFRGNARKLLSLDDEDRKIGESELLGRLQRMGLIPQGATLDDVLSLQIENILERRLQTVVHKKGMATTHHHSRQMIVHGHISIGDHVVNSPSYFVNPLEEKLIAFSLASPLKKDSHKALPANVYKSKPGEDRRKSGGQRPKGGRRGPPHRRDGPKGGSGGKPTGGKPTGGKPTGSKPTDSKPKAPDAKPTASKPSAPKPSTPKPKTSDAKPATPKPATPKPKPKTEGDKK
ncbi:MAG: 30S ribosomal protein S4 [Asgard group archaeon]|nr:30S ribosomal protein S4 [Asgard group archaeon]